jgi:redox-sensitive bicupin YhaK (pirin superfamily)
MTAGCGIVHSERTPPEERARGARLHGFQVWLALPRELEEMEPSFVHHPEPTLPRITSPGVELQLAAGSAYGQRSPVATASETFFLAGRLAAGARLAAPEEHAERALYVAEGELALEGERLAAGTLAVLRGGRRVHLEALRDARLALFGGAPLAGERHVWWNFVSSSRERIERAKADWAEKRFPAVPGESEFIPLPGS